jgi:hypothetical protein
VNIEVKTHRRFRATLPRDINLVRLDTLWVESKWLADE